MVLVSIGVGGLIFVSGLLMAPKLNTLTMGQLDIDLSAILRGIDHWTHRYQTILGVLVAIAVAYLTLSATGRQTSVSERQFLSGQLQSLLSDEATLQFVIIQLDEYKSQRILFENNIAFLETEGDKTSGWLNANQYIRTAFSNAENYRTLISQNTARFLGSTNSRNALVAKLDEIIGSQESIRQAFMSWANLNRAANAEATAPPSQQKTVYLDQKQKTIKLWDAIGPLAQKVSQELNRKIENTKRDIGDLRTLIKSKEN
jgi:hypothetical protein